jgi:hypothetical protein
LKKKNQELEKFKFVLDYKIKELKRQIEPRENEIADMRTQVLALFFAYWCVSPWFNLSPMFNQCLKSRWKKWM